MSSRTRSRRPASIGSNQSSRRWAAVSAADCRATDFVLLLVMAWSPPARKRRHRLGFNHPETTPPAIPTTPRTAPRPHERDSNSAFRSATVSRASVHTEPNVTADALEAARTRIQSLFTRSPNQRDKLTATQVLRDLEQILGMPKSEWNAALVRSLWPA